MGSDAKLDLLLETVDWVLSYGRDSAETKTVLQPLEEFTSTESAELNAVHPVSALSLGHADLLEDALNNVLDERHIRIKYALDRAKEELHWKVDDGKYYSTDADVGEGYRNGNMHTLLIGPENAVVRSDDLLLGFFLLRPFTLYRDHRHLAPEIYVPLTGPSGWRFELGAWQDQPAGSLIYNRPNVVHATRVYETPFLALFCWTKDIGEACDVVSCSDWTKVEEELERRHNAAGLVVRLFAI